MRCCCCCFYCHHKICTSLAIFPPSKPPLLYETSIEFPLISDSEHRELVIMAAVATTTTDVEVGEESPLLANPTDEPLQDLKGPSMAEKAVAGFSAVSFGTSLAAMLFEKNPIVYVSGLIGVVVSPYAAIQQQKITQVEALAQTNERVKEEVNQLKGENVKLHAQVADLSQTIEKLKATKDKLETLQGVQGLSIDELEKQLEESKKILGKMDQNLKGDILNNLIEVAMACDEDGDFTLDDDEIQTIIHKVEQIGNVEIEDEKMKEMIIAKGRQMEGVMDIVKNLLRDDIPEEENIFHFKQ